MEVCKECRKTVKFILCHLKKSIQCQEGYDMQTLIRAAKEAKKEKRRKRYQNNPEPEKDKRNKRYKDNPEPEKDKRNKRYKDNPEPEKEREKEHYLNNPEPKKQNNKVYHQRNRGIILPKMRKYNKSYKPRRAAINKFCKRIFEDQNHHHGDFQHYLMDSAFHLYHHTLGKCNLNTILIARHRIMKLKENCPYCEENLYKIISINKLYCMNTKCRKAICSKCQRRVPADPREDFKHFYIHSGILPGMCPLFEDHDSVCVGLKCSDSKPCHSTEPTVIQVDDYCAGGQSFLPTLPCKKCKEIMRKKPKLVQKCLKIQKFGLAPKDGKKMCKKSKLEVDTKASLKFYKEKEYHFFNCYICGWTETEEHSWDSWKWSGFQKSWYKIPMSADQQVFSIDHPDSPDNCCFGNHQYGIHGLTEQYTNFQFLCNLNEHMKDHGPDGKSCIMIEVLLNPNTDTHEAKENLSTEMEKMENVYKLLAIETIFESCENFRSHHALLKRLKKKAENVVDHKTFTEDYFKEKDICDMWKLGKCSDSNIIVIYLILKRKSSPFSIFEMLDRADYISKWRVRHKAPLPIKYKCKARKNCYCEYTKMNNLFCPVLVNARRENENLDFEHLDDCILPGEKTRIELKGWGGDRVNALTQRIFDFFLPRFKLLLKYCKCEGKLCLAKAKGWDCENCNNFWCQSGDFDNTNYLTEAKRLEMNKPYCITREEGKLILETQFIEDDSTTDYSGSEDDSDETNTTNDSDGESEKSDSSAHSDCDPNYY